MTDKCCPMTFSTIHAVTDWKCEKEKCAWWIKRGTYHGEEGCAIKICALRMDIFVRNRKRNEVLMGKHA